MISAQYRLSRLIALVALALLAASALPPRPALARPSGVVYVVPGGAGERTGADWANARDLRPALLAASAGSELWVKAGTYAPASAADPGFYQAVAFQLKSGVALYGGFAGGETARAQRDVRANPSILSGDLLGNDSGAIHPANPARADNSRNVVRGGGADASAILDGFTIAGGTADGNYPYGGGLDINAGSPTVSNVVFRDNYAERGGAVAVRGQSLPRIAFARFYRNFALQSGGALYAGAGATAISQAVFTGNSVPPGGGGNPLGGGALFIAGGSVTLSHSSLVGNVAGSGSAIYRSQGAATLANSIVWGNLGGPIHGSVAASHSLVQGGYAGTNVISADPRFVDAAGADAITGTADDDLRLRPESPAINAGSNALIPADFSDSDGDGDTAEPTPLDMAGNPRRSDAVDLGAYEVQVAIVGPAPAPATYGAAYSHAFTATGAPDAAYSLVAGPLPPGLTLSAGGVLAGTPAAAGTYELTVQVSGAAGSASRALSLLVGKAPLTVTAAHKVRAPGAANPALTVRYAGFVLGDDAADLGGQPACATTATAASPPGAYPITCGAGSLSAANYAFSFVAGSLLVSASQVYLPAVVR